MNLGDDDLRLLCVIQGETEAFPIDVKRSSWHNPEFIVDDLKKRILEERKQGSLAAVGSHSLELWKPREGNPIISRPKQTLPIRVASARESGEELDPTDSVFTVFRGQPSLDHLHVVVVRKPETGG
ncbi:hypothetical protein D9615_005698 [Tricholomella constricta]|uniref:Crinkler effector protein N-terminal domain-containing protein n=1 Tax=Tricholomella constricta TaxID=117010 RepID=A0A8H5HAI4_9AGAR|nr:hypothetical protein D9615_005698 [Tricholomella constricta]